MPRDKSANHEKIIAAAKKEFLNFGFNDASLRRIAADAGMSASGLYKHFPSKEAMFESLLDPVINGFRAMYDNAALRDFAALDAFDVMSSRESSGDAVLVMSYIYEHYDEFKLLVCRSQGTRYESYLHEIALLEEETTLKYLDEMKRRGIKVKPLRRKEFHLLVSAGISALFQAVEHDFSKAEALDYAKTLDRVFYQGWKTLLNI